MSGSNIPGIEVATAAAAATDGDDDADKCPICLEQMAPLTFRATERIRLPCCGELVCPRCGDRQTDGPTASSLQMWVDMINTSDGFARAEAIRHFRREFEEMEQSSMCRICSTTLPVSEEEAFQMVLKNAAEGHAWAQHTVGTMYERGTGVPLNNPEARRWFEKGAIQGHSLAMFSYGAQLRVDLHDLVEAKKWLEKCLEVNVYPLAQYHLGMILLNGGNGVLKDPQEAFRLFQVAADKGYDSAQCALGQCYHAGPDAGCVRDLEKAVYWFTKAAEQGTDVEAMYYLGSTLMTLAYEKYGSVAFSGKCPVPRALFWFRKAAALGLESPELKNKIVEIEAGILSVCVYCSSPNNATKTRLMACSRCNAAYYCGYACQKSHWKKGHKVDCFSRGEVAKHCVSG